MFQVYSSPYKACRVRYLEGYVEERVEISGRAGVQERWTWPKSLRIPGLQGHTSFATGP